MRTCVIATEMEQRLLLCNFHPDHEGSDLLIFLETYTGSYASICRLLCSSELGNCKYINMTCST